MPVATQSNHEQLLRGVANAAGLLGLTYNGQLVPVVILKRPAAREDLDDPVCFQVYPDRGSSRRERIFGDTWWVWYGVNVHLMAPGNLDLIGHLPDYLTWRAALGHRLADPKAILDCVESVEVTGEELDAQAMADLYDFGMMKLLFQTVEDH